MSRAIGILQRYLGESTIFLYSSHESREEAWNSLTLYGREKYGWKKVVVEFDLQEGEQ